MEIDSTWYIHNWERLELAKRKKSKRYCGESWSGSIPVFLNTVLLPSYMHGRLKWDIQVSPLCCFCNAADEDWNHLFIFGCSLFLFAILEGHFAALSC